MITTQIKDKLFEIRPVTEDDLPAILHVYQGCEDFLALGPVAKASMEMVLTDLKISKEEGGIFCGIYRDDGNMIGIVDFVLNNYEGNPNVAYLSLLMIGSSFREQGVGKAVFNAIENEIRKDPLVTKLLAGVQVNNPQAVRFWQRCGFSIVSKPKLMPDQTTVFDLRKELK
jgi:ribosomal protein S18 acetylase RimI-like enzyme